MRRSFVSRLPALLLGVALLSLLYFGRFWVLLLYNLHGPFREPTRAVLFLAFGAAALSAALYYGLGRLLLRAGPPLATIYLVTTAIVGVQLSPTVCDTHESWVDKPNRRCDCIGWSFEHYTPGIFDGASSDYCVGLEQPVAATTP